MDNQKSRPQLCGGYMANNDQASPAAPPPGWYDDGSGRERWWTGRDWSNYFQTGLQQFHAENTQHSIDVVNCPLCGQSDQLRRVSLVIDEGTTATRGTAITIPKREGRLRLDPTFYVSNSLTQLSSRLTPPKRPEFPALALFFIWWLGSAAAVGLILTVITANPIGFFFGLYAVLGTWIVALIAVPVMAAAQRRKYAARQADWDSRNAHLRSAYYCSRDDVVVADGLAIRPEAFVTSLFPAGK
jgi:hypothetical protein